MNIVLQLVRRFMRQSFELVARLGWPTNEVQQLVDIYQKTLTTAPMGLSMHIIEVFCEELAKVMSLLLSHKYTIDRVFQILGTLKLFKKIDCRKKITKWESVQIQNKTNTLKTKLLNCVKILCWGPEEIFDFERPRLKSY